MHEIFAKANNLNLEVTLYRTSNSYCDDNRRWTCYFEGRSNGTSFKCEAEAGVAADAVSSAWAKVQRLIASGVPEVQEELLLLAQ